MGAAVPCAVLTEHAVARDLYPGLVEAAALIGSTQIQSRATVAGNLCNASPAADTPPALVVLEATCTIAGPSGRREVPVGELTTGPGQTVLRPGELVVDIRVPPPAAGSADAYQRLIPRSEMDIAVVGVAASITLEGGRCTAARIALGAVGPKVILAERAAETLVGKSLDEETMAAAAQVAQSEARPISDLRAPADYREEMVSVLTRRVLAEATERAHQRLASARGA
jgi:carbon-monoxide dehydrogenase medium subunit